MVLRWKGYKKTTTSFEQNFKVITHNGTHYSKHSKAGYLIPGLIQIPGTQWFWSNPDSFFNKLKNKNIADEEYKICVDAWNNNNMKTFKDFLEWYNNLDVIPFIEAIEKMKVFYQEKN